MTLKKGVIGEYVKDIRWYHNEALACWADKRQKGEICEIRQKGDDAGQDRKCRICLEKLPIDTFGL